MREFVKSVLSVGSLGPMNHSMYKKIPNEPGGCTRNERQMGWAGRGVGVEPINVSASQS